MHHKVGNVARSETTSIANSSGVMRRSRDVVAGACGACEAAARLAVARAKRALADVTSGSDAVGRDGERPGLNPSR